LHSTARDVNHYPAVVMWSCSPCQYGCPERLSEGSMGITVQTTETSPPEEGSVVAVMHCVRLEE